MADNILRAYVNATDDDVEHGMTWYPNALALAQELDPTNVRRGVGIIAVLSPMMPWPLNVIKAREAYANNGVVRCLPANAAKALRIWNGENPDSVVGGAKVTSFFYNILGEDEIVRVTIDRHAIDCAYGRAQSDKERSQAVKTTKARDGYGILRSAYVHCAELLSEECGKVITGAQLQAIVWVYWRREMAAMNFG